MQHDWNWTRILAPNLVEAHPTNSCTCVLCLALSSLVSTSLTLRFINLFGAVLKILSCIFIFLSNILFDFAFLLELKTYSTLCGLCNLLFLLQYTPMNNHVVTFRYNLSVFSLIHPFPCWWASGLSPVCYYYK